MLRKTLLFLFLASLTCLRRTEGSQGEVKCVLRDNPTSGPTVLRSELVNDNYCDCLDGSDEPRTAACPGTYFDCKNTGYFTRSIPSAWLSDGHCDCCDGSDEPEGTCVNHCADLMAKALGEANQKADAVRKGLGKRDEYKKLAAEKSVEDDKKVKTLKAQVDVMSKALEKAKTRVAKLEELKKLQDDMKKPETPPESDHKQESHDSPDNSEEQGGESPEESTGEEQTLEKEITDSDKTVDEQDDAELSAEYSSADGHDQKGEDGGMDTDDAIDDDGFDDEVDGDYNDIDEDEENFDDHDADSEPKDEDIKDDVDDDGLGVDEDFKDDIDDAEKFEDDDDDEDDFDDDHDDEHDINRDDHDHADDVGDDNHDDEPDDDYNYERGDEDEEDDYNIRDDEDDDHSHDHDGTSASTDDLDMKEYDVDKLCVKLETARGIPIINKVKALGERALKLLIGSKKKDGDGASEGDEASSNVESCLNQARDARNKLERKKSEIERQVERLEQKQGTDYGKLHGDALRMLHGKCTKTKIMQYEFEHCGFDVVRQYEHGHVIANLGKFKGWDGEMTMKYEGGDKCWNGPVRSIKVELVCGAEELVLSVEEPNRCSYFMKFATPAVCHPNLIVDIMKDFTNVSGVNKDEL